MRGLKSIALSSVLLGGALVVVGSIVGAPAKAATLSVPAIVRDFDHGPDKVNAPAAHPDFETQPTGSDPGITTDRLGSDGKPVYGDHPTGTDTTESAASFNQWYRDVAINRAVPITLDFDLTGSTLTYDSGANGFFPIDGKGWNDPSFNNAGQVDDGHNFSFTMELHMTFTYDDATNQSFTFTGDDDVFVYFNGFKGIDLGGIHGADVATVNLNDIASADKANLVDGQSYPLDIFFAERHTSESNFKIDANFAAAAAPTSTTTTTTAASNATTTSTTVATTTSTVRATSTTSRVAANIVRTGSPTSPLVGLGVGLLALGALLGLVDRNRYRGQHFIRN